VSQWAEALQAKITAGDARVSVVGMGYVGLSLAVELAKAGLVVRGIDLDLERVSLLNEGRSYLVDVSDEALAPLVRAGRLAASTGFDDVGDADAIIICVPTPLRKSKEPDISFILSAVESVLPRLRKGQLMVLESTTYPGTTEEVVQPRLESLGLVMGEDFFLAFSPERVDPGNKKFTTATIPKVVGGVTRACTALAAALYRRVTATVFEASSPRVAETAKLLENTFRSVNIGLVNEMAIVCDKLGVNVWEVIDAAATKPFGFMKFTPGPGLGGHCIPIDPHYLAWKMRALNYKTRFIDLAGELNSEMPLFWVRKLADSLNDQGKSVKGSKVLVIGVAYKKDIDDLRESPALDILRLLEERGADVTYHDPYVKEFTEEGHTRRSVPLTADTLRAADAAMIVTDHSSLDYGLIRREARSVTDTRNALASRKG